MTRPISSAEKNNEPGSEPARAIRVRGARQHNLRNISIDIPRDRLVVLTGLSGSGKSSLAFDTIHAEGQRMYVETLSAYARQFLEQLQKPDIDHIEGLPPTIAIEQRSGSASPRSTVATTTEIYDYLRLLYARVGQPHCWVCGEPIERQDVDHIVDGLVGLPEGTRMMILAPLVRGKKGEHAEVLRRISKEGFVRVRVDGEYHELGAMPPLAKTRKHFIDVVVDRIVIKKGIRSRLAESVGLALSLGDQTVFIATQDDAGEWRDQMFTANFACVNHPDVSLPELSPRLFSFNSPHGACPACDGLGHVQEFDADLIVSDPSRSLIDGAIEAWRKSGKRLNLYYKKLTEEFCLQFGVAPDTPFNKIHTEKRRILMDGTTDEQAERFGARFEGVLPNLRRRWQNTDSESLKHRLHAFLSEHPCEACQGARLRPEAMAVTIASKNINNIAAMSVDAAARFFDDLAFTGEHEIISRPILREISQRLKFMVGVGVGYLGLSRASATLSGGESQRIRLATQVGSGLVGVCYVLDEPTIGLHQRDAARLIRTLRRLVDAGNTVLVVEHDADVINAADHLIDIGPGAGAHGGHIVAQGSLADVVKHEDSITAKYLRGDKVVPVPETRRKIVLSQSIQIEGAAENNLKDIDVTIPIGGIVCVTGVSGSGKSTLINEVLLKAMRRRLHESRDKPGEHRKLIGASRIDKVVQIDQSPIGRTPRSNPCTYTGAFDLIREMFAKTREAKLRGYSAGRFSFNVKGGRCEACQGQGIKRIEMHFLPDTYVVCDICRGRRYNRETLEVRYRGKTIADILDMRVEEAIPFFDNLSKIKQLIVALDSVGLSYMTLGQPSTTLSGGEAQRVKLAAELGRTPMGHTLYVLDEPTTGLHFADVDNLLHVLNRIADKGHTVLIIEHNLEVIKQADWIIDLGPEGGDGGGRVVVAGRPEEVAQHETSFTGRFLREKLASATPSS